MIRKIPSTKAKILSLGGTFLLALVAWVLNELCRAGRAPNAGAQDPEAQGPEAESGWESKRFWAYAMLMGGMFLA